MARAVCLRCGAFKAEPAVRCPRCGRCERRNSGRIRAVFASRHHLDDAALAELSAQIAEGRPPRFDEARVRLLAASLPRRRTAGYLLVAAVVFAVVATCHPWW